MRLTALFLCSFSLLFGNEEECKKRIYAHLLIADSRGAVSEAKAALQTFPGSEALQSAYIHALSEKGDETEAMQAFTQRQGEKLDRNLLEILAWAVLQKGQ